MGRNNQQRRAAKKRRRQRTQRSAGTSRPSQQARRTGASSDQYRAGEDAEWTTSDRAYRASRPSVDQLLHGAMAAWRLDQPLFAAVIEALLEQARAALPVAEQRLAAAVDQLWGRGWTPTDVVHVVTRQLTAHHAELIATQVVADGHRRVEHGQSLHARWLDQLTSLEEGVGTSGVTLPEERLRRSVEVLCLLTRLPTVIETVPAPGESYDALSGVAHLDPRMLSRVRALLAKAESTEFEDEAEAFTAKAQELIARYAIDEAMLHTVDDVGEPSVRRILIDDPYADAKANLLAELAGTNRCQLVYSSALGWVTVFGYEHDLDAVELLAASLLTQATAAMVRHGSRRDAAGRSRTRSFRRAFLLGFAQRIGERLRQATAGQMSAADEGDGRFVPVLAARDDRVKAAAEAAFPELERRTVSVSNATGWTAGRAAAELAELGVSPHRLPAT